MFAQTLLVFALLISSLAFGQGSVLLVGGGSEDYNDWSDEPYHWLVQQAANKNILVLHYSEPSSFLPNYFKALGAATATNLVINSRAAANDSATFRALLQADGLFLRGGDQWQYVSLWKGTLTENALRQVFARGGVIGGTSAGAMVLSEIVFDARVTSVDPRQALRTPLAAGITLTSDFLPFVPDALVDTHFYERGRLGRLLAMLTVYRSEHNRWITGIGVDDRTGLGISSDGSAEVFGSGVVALLRATEQTQYAVQTAKPLSLSHVQLVQMTKGFRVEVLTGQLLFVPPTATAYAPEIFIVLPPAIFVDGSDQAADWFSNSGSLQKFLARFAASDTVGIFSSPTAPNAAQALGAQLSQRNVSHHLLWLDSNTKNSAELAQRIVSCRGLIFVSNLADSIAAYLGPQTLVGQVWSTRLDATSALAFLGNDAKLAGTNIVGQTEITTTAAYRGRLKLFDGLGRLSAIVMPRAFQDPDYHENRMCGLFWGIAKTNAHYGVLLDAGTHLQASENLAQVFGATPAIIVNAFRAQWVDFSTYRASNSVGPRQSAALTNAMLHVVAHEQQFDFIKGEMVKVEERAALAPLAFDLYQNYPNPFNPSTTITYKLPERAHVVLEIFDLQGKRVTKLVDEAKKEGRHEVTWKSATQASGVYWYRVQASGQSITKKMLLMR